MRADTRDGLGGLSFCHSCKADPRILLTYRSSSGSPRIASANCLCAFGSTGRCLTRALGGYAARKLPPRQSLLGRTGLGAKPPPQFGHTFNNTFSTQARQKVHSNEQIIASVEFGASALLQCSQVALSSSIRHLKS